MKKHLIYGILSIAIMESFIINQRLQAQSLFDTVTSDASSISGSTGPVSGTLSGSGASGSVAAGESTLNTAATSAGLSANVSGLANAGSASDENDT